MLKTFDVKVTVRRANGVLAKLEAEVKAENGTDAIVALLRMEDDADSDLHRIVFMAAKNLDRSEAL